MRSMEEILDLDEMVETVVDEKLKEFMDKDEEIEKRLNEKIDQLAKEEEKLREKESEIIELEESSREKISSNASADELIEIAEKIKEAEAEQSVISQNIENLSNEKDEIIQTKESIEQSRIDYIKNLNSVNDNYNEQLKKISEAIDVCDNPALKQVLEDVKASKSSELETLKEKRISALREVLNEDTSESEENAPVQQTVIEPKNEINENIVQEIKPKMESSSEQIININSILDNSNLDVVSEDSLVIPQVNPIDVKNEENIRIIYERDVADELLSQIYSSSKIMPNLFDYLDNKGGIANE